MTSFDMDSSYDKAAMGALSGEKCPACGTNIDRKPGEHWVLLDGGKRVCTNPWHNPKGFDRRKPAVQPCKYGDPFCPCQDGDMCHYEGENPMPPTSTLSGEKCPTCKSDKKEVRNNADYDDIRDVFIKCSGPWHSPGSTMSEHSKDCAIHGCEGWNGPRFCDCGAGSTGAEPAPECKQCAFWHDHGHKSLTKGRWSDCGHPCFLGTDKCEVCANTEPAPDWMERAAEELSLMAWDNDAEDSAKAVMLAILKKHAGGGTGK